MFVKTVVETNRKLGAVFMDDEGRVWTLSSTGTNWYLLGITPDTPTIPVKLSGYMFISGFKYRQQIDETVSLRGAVVV